MHTIEDRVRHIIAEISGLSTSIPGDANLYLDLGMASVYAVQLLMDLEEKFQVSVPDEAFVEATSIQKLTAMMEGLTSHAEGSASA
jgi:acyl carrier protein